MQRPLRIDPFDPFEVVLQVSGAIQPVVLQSAQDPNGATAAFHKEARTLLWQPLR